MYIERTAFFCLLCGMFAIYYVSASLYVLVSIVLVFLLFLLYDSRANRYVIHTRGNSIASPLSKLVILFRVWIESSLLSVMKTYEQFTPLNRRIDTNVSNYSEGDKPSSFSQQGYFIDNSDLDCEDFKVNNRHNTVGTCFSTSRTVDSMHNMNKSSNTGWGSAFQTARYVHVSKDASFSSKESPWGKSVSPKLRSHSSGVKTLQTVAGPLLASTRFNINVDVGLYGNMSSPGFSSRIAHYATESSRTVTHQKQYSTPGQFPIVHLDHNSSKLPIITSCRSRQSTHSAVMIRIAPPEISDTRLLNKSQILGSNSTQEQQSSKSVLEVLKEMSRKRIHAQLDENEDDDVIKRQRKSETHYFSDQNSDSEQVDITPIDRGKRVREDSPSQCELVGQSSHHKSKRTRNNEILSSLSSSRNLLTHMKTSTKRKSSTSEWSGSSTSIWGKPPKQACGNIERTTAESPKIGTEVRNVISPITSVCTTAPSLSIEQSTGKSSSVKPSEFLPKFAAVLDKNSGPMLTSVAALEAKRVYDSKTRLRSMLAVIAGEDDFIRKPVSSTSEDSTPAAGTFTSTTTNISFPATLPLVAMSSKETNGTTMKEKVIIPEISKPTITVSLSQNTTSIGNLVDTNIHVGASTPIISTTSSEKDSNKCLESVTSEVNKSSSSAVTSLSVPVDQKKTDITCIPTAVNSREELSESTKKQEDSTSLSHVATTSTNNLFSFGSNSFNSSHSELLKSQSENSPQSIVPPKTNLDVSGASVTSSNHTTKSSLLSHKPDSNSSGGFNASSVSTVVSTKPVLLPETTNNLFSFVKPPDSGPLNGPNTLSSHTTSALFATVSSSIITKPSGGLFISPSVSSSICSVTSSTKSDVNHSTIEPNKSLQFEIKPAVASCSSNINNPFQLNAVSKNSVNPVGGFKFDFSKGINEKFVSGSFQNNKIVLTTNNTNSTTSIATTSVPAAAATTTITTTTNTTSSSNATTTSGTNVPSVTNTSAPITTFTSQSSSPFQFGSTVSKPVFSFGSNVNTSNGPLQSSGFTVPIFGSSLTQEERISQTPEQKPFTFGTSASSSLNQNFGGTFSFGSTASNNVKSAGFTFGGSANSSNKLKDGPFGADQKNKAQEIGSVFRANDALVADQSSKPIFQGSSTKSGAVSGIFCGSGNSSTQTLHQGDGFGSSAQSTAIFGNISGQGQPASGTFGTGGDSLSSAVFGSGTGQTSNIFGNPGSTTTGGVFGNSITQPQTSQQSTGLFGNIANQTSRESQPSGSIFGTASQQSGGIFDSVSSTSGQRSAGVFGESGSSKPVFAFGSASIPAVTSSTGLFGASTSLQTPFQFGAGGSNSTSVQQPSGGFNFGNSGVNPSSSAMFFSSGTSSNNAVIQSGAGTTPIFGQAPAQGMFSIGSGSTAPRARSTRSRRQR